MRHLFARPAIVCKLIRKRCQLEVNQDNIASNMTLACTLSALLTDDQTNASNCAIQSYAVLTLQPRIVSSYHAAQFDSDEV